MIPFNVRELVKLAIKEDTPYVDITSEAIFQTQQTARLRIISEEDCIFSGNIIIGPLIEEINPSLRLIRSVADGDHLNRGDIVIILEGETKDLLTMERPLLNFISRLSGISTLTHRVVTMLKDTDIKLVDTRKTTPGWRYLEKYAVRCGGGKNHRFGLSDGILIKDNHKIAAGSLKEAIERAKRFAPHPLRIEVEVDTLREVDEAVEGGADIILLDNFSPEMVKEAIERIPPGIMIEVSGGITPENIGNYLIPGVNYISSGFITYNARWCGFTAEIENIDDQDDKI